MNAYRAYKNESVLVYAEEMYNQGTAYMITPENAAAGAFVNKSSIQGTCNGGEWPFFCSLMRNGLPPIVSNAGGVFWASNIGVDHTKRQYVTNDGF